MARQLQISDFSRTAEIADLQLSGHHIQTMPRSMDSDLHLLADSVISNANILVDSLILGGNTLKPSRSNETLNLAPAGAVGKVYADQLRMEKITLDGSTIKSISKEGKKDIDLRTPKQRVLLGSKESLVTTTNFHPDGSIHLESQRNIAVGTSMVAGKLHVHDRILE